MFPENLMSQFQENLRTDGRTDGQTLFHRTLPAMVRGPKILPKPLTIPNNHCKNTSSNGNTFNTFDVTDFFLDPLKRFFKNVLESLFNKVAGLQACNFIKKRLRHKVSNVFEGIERGWWHEMC